jgi:hypothetical protein|tara:strand:+ start:15877 stop:16860 length:984 start_codon:yes stop_codon:yes gene_type:complete
LKNLIYYPSFEPTDLNWLKYALLYIDDFSPIVPERGRNQLSDNYKRILSSTDLIKIHKPEWWQGDNAATKVLKEIEFIQAHPEQFRDKLYSVNINKTWKNPENWTFDIYEEKFNVPFKHHCIENGLGVESAKGITVSRELAQLYMTFLAEEIAFEEKANPITDSSKFDRLSSYLRAKNPEKEELLQYAQTTIDISLPKHIKDIKIDKLIEFREDSEIKELRIGFNNLLNKFYENLENDFDPKEFLNSLDETNTEFMKRMILFFGSATATYLGGMILAENPDNISVAKQAIQGSILSITGISGIKKSWKKGNDKRSARKFLSKVNNLK